MKLNLRPLLRTITGKNKAGKIIHGLVGIGGVTGVASVVQPDLFSWESIALVAIGIAITVVTAKGWFTQAMAKEFKDILNKYRDIRKPESEGGMSVTDAEKAQLFDELVDFVEEVLEKFDISIDLDGDGK